MSEKPSFFAELKRRNVYKVEVAYIVASVFLFWPNEYKWHVDGGEAMLGKGRSSLGPDPQCSWFSTIAGGKGTYRALKT